MKRKHENNIFGLTHTSNLQCKILIVYSYEKNYVVLTSKRGRHLKVYITKGKEDLTLKPIERPDQHVSESAKKVQERPAPRAKKMLENCYM